MRQVSGGSRMARKLQQFVSVSLIAPLHFQITQVVGSKSAHADGYNQPSSRLLKHEVTLYNLLM